VHMVYSQVDRAGLYIQGPRWNGYQLRRSKGLSGQLVLCRRIVVDVTFNGWCPMEGTPEGNGSYSDRYTSLVLQEECLLEKEYPCVNTKMTQENKMSV
jgi:hypothetical protein